MHDIIVVGAGPSGMTAALYALRSGKSVVVLEGESFGGQISYSSSVENYPSLKQISGSEFSFNLFEQIKGLGADIEFEKAVKITDGDIKKAYAESGKVFEGKSVIIATGVKQRKLGIPKEEHFIGKGISYCAVCDGPFFKKKDVAVIGGGDTALQDALYLSEICKTVYLVHRRDSFRGAKQLSDRARAAQNIELVLDSTVREIIGDEKIEGIVVKNKADERREISISGLFVAVGQVPQVENFKGLEDFDAQGYFNTDESTITKTKGIFVAGDCRRKFLRQLTTAVSDGSVAGIKAAEYVDSLS